jgi:hypothetical protein
MPKDLYSPSYIYLYNMGQTMAEHSPTLESVMMVEKAAKRYSQECGKYQLWKKLPRKMMYQTFLAILGYLEQSGKLIVDKEGCVIWTWDPEGVRRLIKEGLIMR